MRKEPNAMLMSAVRDELCLEFANTRSWRGSAAPTERLNQVEDLLRWIERTVGMGGRAMRPIETWARNHPEDAAELFTQAVGMRETIYRLFSSVAAGEAIPERDFAALKTAIAAAPARTELVRSGGRYGWQVDDLPPSAPHLASHLLAPVLWSAGDLLLSADRRRIRRCANEDCLWLFLDESKSGTRRWCDMASCGNRAKARRHYAKVKRG
jgi:predicted RNA-binding Zn ribbon-like protein